MVQNDFINTDGNYYQAINAKMNKEVFLVEDITGPYSGIEYGKAGDKVEVIGERGNMVLVENKGERFHVWPNKLSDISDIEPEPVKQVEEKKIVSAWLPKENNVAEEPATDLFGEPMQYISKKKRSKK